MTNFSKIDTKTLLERVDIVDVIDARVPLSKSGVEWEACCPFHTEKTPSFKVNQAKQIFQCFGCGEHGDAIEFLVKYDGVSFKEACRILGADIPADDAAQAQPAKRVQHASKQAADEASEWVVVRPVPVDAPEPFKAHIKRGKPQMVWQYRDGAGRTLGYVYRFTTSTGGKETIPLTWCKNIKTGAQSWRWRSFDEPRPLYGLDALASMPDAPVLVVEGEKCRDFAQAQLPDWVVVSWPGGGKAVKKADWSPLYGRQLTFWADADAKRVPLSNAEKATIKKLVGEAGAQSAIDDAQLAKPLLPEQDQPGVKAMTSIYKPLLSCGDVSDVWWVNIPKPGDKPDGWDCADAIADGLCGPAFERWIIANRSPVAGACVGVEMPADTAQTEPAHTQRKPSAVEVDDDGIPVLPEQAWRKRLLRKDGEFVDCRENVYLVLRHHPDLKDCLWADEFARKIVKRKKLPWESEAEFNERPIWGEDDDLRLGLWLARALGMRIRATDTLATAVGWAARDLRCHPVREYLDGLVWDGVDRLDHWLVETLGTKDTEYTRLSGRFFLMGMVARIYKPGCQMRFMPILEGYQYRGKSSALRVLAGDWFSDAPLDLNNKDTYQLLQGIWLFEIAELDAFNRSESTRMKAFVSSQEDHFRAPYDRAPKKWPRQLVFAGTTNQDEYFKDKTGNTRYWPWRVEERHPISLDLLSSWRDQLFAEAVQRFNAGERFHPTADEQIRLFSKEQESREISDPWQTKIEEALEYSTQNRFTSLEILTDILKVEVGRIDNANQMSTRVGQIMHKMGWLKRRETSGKRTYYYVRPNNEQHGGDPLAVIASKDTGNDPI